jgi:hypothetical protein
MQSYNKCAIYIINVSPTTTTSVQLQAFDNITHVNLTRIKPHEMLCDTVIKQRCIVQSASEIFYHDASHLSMVGVKLFLPQVLDAVFGRLL